VTRRAGGTPRPDVDHHAPRRDAGIDLHLFEQFAELTPDAMVVVDRAGMIVLANGRVERVFGYARDELIGQPLDRLVPERLAMGASRVELRGVRRDGSEFPVEISLSSIQTERGPMAAAAIRDVSDRARSHQSSQASRMESIGQLAGGVAHDFNNLLSVILGNAGFLLDQLASGSSEREEALEIRRAAERAAGLTRQLLLFSRQEAIEALPVDVNATVRDIERLLRRTIGEHVELVTDLAETLPRVLAGPGALEQVFVNLAVNARDAMPRGGRLTIASSTTQIGAEDAAARGLTAGEYVRLAVRDTGTGMAPEVLARALEPFFSTKPKGEGTGLGLATVSGIVAQCGGGIEIDSWPGSGTLVRVVLPVARAGVNGKATPAAKDATRRGTGQHVLVVEDETAVRGVAERLMRRAGYQVSAVARGSEALDVMRSAAVPVDLLLTDVVMPEMLGPELVARARTIRPDIAVVFMSGYIDPGIELGELANATLVEKPFTEAMLTRAVEAALAGRV